jgi:hypothetical protein
MVGFVGVIALLTVLFLSLLITRLASVALKLTGLSSEAARFQARSAFTGTGFTTGETEKVVKHPVRRRIIMLLMITRSAGLISIIISLILSFATAGEESGRMVRLLWMVGGIICLWLVANIKFVDRAMSGVMEWALKRWTDLDTRDYTGLLNLHGEYSVRELRIQEDDWLVGKKLKDCKLNKEGITVLGIYRENGSYVGAPRADTEMYTGDLLILYGRGKRLRELDERRADARGEMAHERAVSEQREHEEEQERQEQAHKKKKEREEKRTG